MIRGVPSRRKTVVAARASVGPTIAPSVNATGQLMPGTSACATTATTTIVNRTRPIDSRRSGAEVRAQIPDRGFGRGGEEQRRQEDEQDEVRLELDAGKARDEGQRETTQHEQCRIRHADAAGDLVHDRDGDEDQQDCGQGLHDGLVDASVLV